MKKAIVEGEALEALLSAAPSPTLTALAAPGGLVNIADTFPDNDVWESLREDCGISVSKDAAIVLTAWPNRRIRLKTADRLIHPGN